LREQGSELLGIHGLRQMLIESCGKRAHSILAARERRHGNGEYAWRARLVLVLVLDTVSSRSSQA